eukprot:TRINITY_DN2588_c0_g1_i2.p1 TRINITY_DN2588_c0_g1~~TRINITY_DN2588_c0_g1_i2.p1  ORF type:complete len:559 (-),score=224.15 TRINITY_DN2588_c0_g1_i2:1184-2860(-)
MATIESLTISDAETLKKNPDASSNNEKIIEKSSENQEDKKKKKKKKKEIASIHPISVELMKKFPVKLESTRLKGRHSTAAEALKPGTLVNDEKATAWIVRDIYMREYCHYCNNETGYDAGLPPVGCLQCKWAFYCSPQCKDSDAKRHSLQCPSLPKLISIAEKSSTDLDLIRLILSLIAAKRLESEDKEEDSNNAEIKPTPFVSFEEMISNREHFNDSWVESVTLAIKELEEVLSPELKGVMTQDEMLLAACRINSNSHGFGDVKGKNRDVSLGVAPLTALFFNHSCSPNCSFVGTTNGKLQVRTLRNIEKGEELVVNYVDLFAPRHERRQRLLATKFFWCNCKRCSEPYETSSDRFLNAMKCKNCKDGYISIEQIKTKEEIQKEPEACDYTCGSCKAKVPSAVLEKTMIGILEPFDEGHQLIQQKQYSRARKSLEKALQLAEKDLHPSNCFIANISVPLQNCCEYEEDYVAVIRLNKGIINSMEKSGAIPPNWYEIADYCAHLGEVLLTAANGSKNQAMAKKMRQESRESYAKATAIRTIYCGPDHPRTLSLSKQKK